MVRRRRRGALRLLGLVFGGAGAFVLIAALALPLVLRGPRFAALARGMLPATAGRIELAGGTVGLSAAFALLFGRPFVVTVEGLRITDPEGTEVFAAPKVSARVELAPSFGGVVVHDLAPGRARWRLARMRTRPGIGFFAAFLRPDAAPRASGAPSVRPAPAPASARPRRPRFAFELRGVTLDGLDAAFDFPSWGLVLRDVRARGALAWGGADAQAPVRFEARDVDARAGGVLRLGRGAKAAALPVSRARLPFVGTPAEAPSELRIEVAAAETGFSRLEGRLAFGGLFRARREGPPLSFDLRARWDRAGDGLRALLGSLDVPGLVVGGEEARVTASARSDAAGKGAFVASAAAEGLAVAYRGFRAEAIALSARAEGPPGRIALDAFELRAPAGGVLRAEGTLALGAAGGARPEGEARLKLRFEDFATAGALPATFGPLSAQRVDGWLHARTALGRQEVSIDDLDLRIDLAPRGRLPREVRMVGAPPARIDPAAGGPAGGGRRPGRDRVTRARPARPMRNEGTATLVVRGLRFGAAGLSVAALETDLFAGRLTGQGRFARGPSGAATGFAGTLVAERIDLSRALPRSRVGGVLSFRVQAEGGAEEGEARAVFARGGAVDLPFGRYRLPETVTARLRRGRFTIAPALFERAGGGAVQAGGSVGPNGVFDLAVAVRAHPLAAFGLRAGGEELGGRLDGALRLTGARVWPVASGRLSLADVHWGAARLGDATIEIAARGARATALTGTGSLFAGARLDLEVARVADAIAVDGALGGGTGADETRLRLVGRGDGERWRAAIEGPLSLALLRPLLRARGLEGSGALDTSFEVRRDRGTPSVRGRVAVRTPLRLAAPAWPSALEVRAGAVALDEAGLAARALELHSAFGRARIDGTAALAPGAPRGLGALDLAVDAALDARLFVKALPRLLSDAHGPLQIRGRLLGDGVEPRFVGAIDLGALTFVARAAPAPLQIDGGRIAIDGRSLRLDRIVILPPLGGRLTVGPAGMPARLHVDRLSPLALSGVDLSARGENVALQTGALTIDDAEVALRLHGASYPGTLALSGLIDFEAGRFRPLAGRSGGDGVAAAAARKVPAAAPVLVPIALDLRLRSSGERFVIDPGRFLPDLHFGLDFHVGGTLARPQVKGDADARGLYSAIVLFLVRLFSDRLG